jgi:hypothetical protein
VLQPSAESSPLFQWRNLSRGYPARLDDRDLSDRVTERERLRGAEGGRGDSGGLRCSGSSPRTTRAPEVPVRTAVTGVGSGGVRPHMREHERAGGGSGMARRGHGHERECGTSECGGAYGTAHRRAFRSEGGVDAGARDGCDLRTRRRPEKRKARRHHRELLTDSPERRRPCERVVSGGWSTPLAWARPETAPAWFAAALPISAYALCDGMPQPAVRRRPCYRPNE